MEEIINEKLILECMAGAERPSSAGVEAVLKRGALGKGLSLEDAAVLANATGSMVVQDLFKVAAQVKNDIYGERLVLFAPLYVSDYCVNDCEYCNFHSRNERLKRRRLTMDEIAAETKCLIDMGHKRVLIEFGEDPERNTIDYICKAIETIYSVRSGNGNIRRVNVNIAATTTENYRRLKDARIGTYQLFQETYHRATYERLHRGPKADYNRQITAHNRAREAGLDDLGIGVLFGLYDWRFEVMALVAHAQYMERVLGVGPHTMSVPRWQSGPTVTYRPEFPVSDGDFLKIIAILRIAVPYTGMILTTRESPELRRKAFKLGISQASAASVTSPGGYVSGRGGALSPPDAGGHGEPPLQARGQFYTQDHRPVDEVIKSIMEDDLIPSFCTACYRIGRTGEKFMELAKPGDIHEFCRPNALLTFAEYLEDYADVELKRDGYALIEKYIEQISDEKIRRETIKRIQKVKGGARDLYF